MNKIILASASPRRSELLKQIGLPFTVCKSTCEEKITCEAPEEVVRKLSRAKARDVWHKLWERPPGVDAAALGGTRENVVVLGADTVVACRGKILGKPEDTRRAEEMLCMLSGSAHEVYTGVTFCYLRGGEERTHTFCERTEVTFYPMSEQEIRAYAASGDPLDKAGAYGIQGACAAYIKGISGDYNNVVGLPVGRVYQELKECGLL